MLWKTLQAAGVVALLTLAGGRAAEAQPAPGPGQPPPNYPPPPPTYPPPSTYPPSGPGPYYGPPGSPYQYPNAYGGPPPGAERHDGFYLHLQLGPGFTSAKASSGPDSITLSGGGFGFSIAAGGALNDNLILFGELLVDSALSPDVEVNGVKTATLDNASAGLGGFGAGVAYYVMPVNLFLSGALTASRLTVNDSNGNEVGSSDLGIGIDLDVGKEWWVSDNWGLGVVGQFFVASMKDKDALPGGDRPTWKVVGFSVALSATFN
jgi:hypothetical protein